MDLTYKEYGNKNASLILFLHGGGVGSWMWNKQIQYFENYHCVTVDLPEQGENKYNYIFSIEDSAHRVIEIIKKLSKSKTTAAVGFSLGAQVLVKILSLEPDIIDYSIINSALVIPMKGKVFIEPLIKLSFPLIKNRTFSKLQAKTLYIGEEYYEKYYNESKDMRIETLVRILKENMVFELPDGFNKAKGEILVTVGTKEKSIMKRSASNLTNSNPNCTGIIISSVGHGVPLSEPNLFNQIIERWLNKDPLPDKCIPIKTDATGTGPAAS